MAAYRRGDERQLPREAITSRYFTSLRSCRRSSSWGHLRRLDCSLALSNLHPNHLIQAQKRPKAAISPVFVSLEREVTLGRYWLTAAANGSLSIYDRSSLSSRAYECRAAVVDRPRFPLGYVPTEEELNLQGLRPTQFLIPSGYCNLLHQVGREEQVGHTRSSKNGQAALNTPAALGVTCVQWLPGDPGGVLSSEADGTVTLWDITTGSHRGGHKPRLTNGSLAARWLWRGRCAKSVLRIGSSQACGSRVGGSGTSSDEIKCDRTVFILCCEDDLHPLKILDLRVGGVVAGFGLPSGHNINLGAVRRAACQAARCPTRGSLIAAAFTDRVVSLWDVRSPTRPLTRCLDARRLQGIEDASNMGNTQPGSTCTTHSSVVSNLIFTTDGTYLISTSILGGKCLQRALAHHDHVQLWHTPTATRAAVQYDTDCLAPDSLPELKSQYKGRNLQTSVVLMDGNRLEDSYLVCGIGSQVVAYGLKSGQAIRTVQCDTHRNLNILNIMSAPSPPSFVFNDPSNGMLTTDDQSNVVPWRGDDHTAIEEPLLSSAGHRRARGRASVTPVVF